MPQLDLVTFFTQFFWAILSFFLFYFFVNKLILPELTRALKYRSKASALSNSAETDARSQTREEHSLNLPDTSGKSGCSTLYNYAGHNSARVLKQARQRKDTFLQRVLSGRALDVKGFAKSTSSEKAGSQELSLESPSSTRATKAPEKSSSSKDIFSTQKLEASQNMQSSSTAKLRSTSENVHNPKGSKKKRKV